MHTITKAIASGATSLTLVALPAGSALAHTDDGGGGTSNGSTIIKIAKHGLLSKSRNIAWIKVKVTCSPDVTDARLEGTLAQVTHGNAQENTGVLAAYNAFECNGNEEWVYLPVRRPTGGFHWVKGAARVFDFVFATEDPANGWTYDHASGRTIYLRR
ncbi:hypothetical protein [Nocardioides panaciterrulae]|uniref:PLAT domain-containing protein n=1 Tax=Nocardioides panaciterrulae TaxID=661492 RepID=A0A7Y9E7C7_9ACTN|nr:hypothetical protein [Nocardioides panaciterrulae]NYD42494.1 hypothetical protein [Nocardioides panaciterrulae]